MKAPYIIGIAGGTGSGKTTVAEKIEKVLNENISVITQDAFYKEMYNIPVGERNYDHPNAFDIQLLIESIEKLKKGNDINIPIYNFKNHRRLKETKLVKYSPVIVIEGILIFYYKELRDLMNFKIYVDTPSDVRLARRVLRDINERGRSIDSVIDQYLNTVRPMHIEFVSSTRKFADIIVPEGGYNDKAIDFMTKYLKSIF
ncbi:uridine kinase [bacterium]|nr:uridine kinase [bacterium]